MNLLHLRSRQAGASLLVSLIMLVVITLLVVSAINSSNVNLRIAGNMQARDEVRAAAQQAIEQFVSNYANFYPTAAATSSVNIDIDKNGTNFVAVSIATPICKRASPQVPARSAACANGVKSGLICWDTLWEVTAIGTSATSGASQSVTQGVAITMNPAFNPISAGC